MKAIFDDRQWKHQPRHFMANGAILPNPEQAERINRLQAGAQAAGCVFQAPQDAGLGPIAALHSAEYLYFLENIYPRWRRIDGAGEEVIPNIHPETAPTAIPNPPSVRPAFIRRIHPARLPKARGRPPIGRPKARLPAPI